MKLIQKFASAVKLCLHSFVCYYDTVSVKSIGAKIISAACAFIVLLSYVSYPIMTVAVDEEPDFQQLSFELYPNEQEAEKTVTLNGMMPKDAYAEAVDVTADFSDDTDFDIENTASDQEEQSPSVLAAYNITITDGENEYQPGEENPIHVEITNPEISADSNTTLWHITDDGTREQITDFSIENGKISFYATGFSVYAIVSAPDPYVPDSADYAASIADLTGERASSGLYLYYTPSAGVKKYFSSSLNSKNCLVEVEDKASAAVWYFENDGDDYQIYTYVSGVKKYIKTKSGNEIKLDSTGDLINISNSTQANSFIFKKKDDDRWLQHSNGGGGIRYYTDAINTVNTSIYADFTESAPITDDYYGLDGATYGFMNYSGGTLGDALMAEGEDNYLDMISLIVRKESGNETLYVAQDSDISMWTFHFVSEFDYLISTEVNGQTKYLNIDNGSLSLVDLEDASAVTVTTNSAHKIRLSSDGYSVTFGSNGFTASATNASNSSQWLNLVETAGLSDEDYITYYADKVSISNVPDGSEVLIYTRVWDDNKKAYEFYAVGHDGTLYPCYERGDNITWVGTQINTLLWDFTEYHYDDGTPNYYYELYNPYSQKYIAPQIANGQILSDNKIGINLPGRREGEYYSDILAWDDPYYTYAALKSDIDNGTVVSTSRSDAQTYYFALIESPTATLTKVNTIDNNQFGITMKMVDFPAQTNQNGGFYGVQSNFLEHYNGRKNGILSTDLDENGYPKVTANGKNLGDLYAGSSVNTEAEKPYDAANEVNHLFIESIYNASGYFEFDSCQNFATLRNENNVLGSNFTVYKELGTTNLAYRTTLSHGQFFPYNNITAGVYSTTNPENLYSALAVPGNATMGLLPESDPRKYEKLHAVNGSPNYYNGMEMEASFVQTPSGKDAWGHDIVFEFTGDDDFWFYVDGELVLDLGGIHSALAGRVNFATGDVVVDGTQTNLRTIFKQNYETRNPNATTEEVNEYLANYFNEGENIFKDYSAHTMRIFYMERGAGASNLHMRFNLSSVTPGDVLLTKTVSGSDDIDFNLVEYPYQIWYIDEEYGEEKLLRNNDANISVTYKNGTQRVRYEQTYTPPNSTQSYSSVYFLNPGKSADIHFPANTIKYKIVECGINSEVYDTVSVNGETITGGSIGNTNRSYYSTDWLMVSERPTVTFDNHVDPDSLRTLSFQKKLYDESGNELTAEQDPTTFSFRLYLSNGIDDNLMLANMYHYYVKDPNGYLCRWDSATQKFVATEKTDYHSLTDAEKTQMEFDTSMNGAISKIPAGYTVEVPNLPVGMKFKVEERASEIPLGYKFVEYDRESGTYHAEDGDTLNSGWVRANESPKMYIHNKRGWELEANKIWSDKAFTSSHDSIYTAVYVGNDLLAGSVKKMTHPNTSVRYFIDELQQGATFEDYKVYEVELLNPTFDANGELTGYDSIQRKLNDGDLTTIDAVAKNASTPSAYSYATTYNRGTPRASSTATSGNIRTDTITNTRTGGVVITLYDMNTNEPLAGGTFALTEDDTTIGMFISDENGRVTILYDFDRDQDYVLTETNPPETYIGLPNSAVFSIGADDSVTISGNDAIWQTGYKSPNAGDSLIAYIDVFNKPFTLQAKKVDSETNDPLADAHFSLYRSVTAIGGTVKDVAPIPGYEDLVTLADGVIPRIDNTLQPGKYYLTEKTAPSGYKLLSEDIVFTISELGVVTIESNGHEDYLTTTGSAQTAAYVLTIPNETSDAELTITKTVDGAFCNEYKDFTFTLTVDGAAETDEYEWTKNDVEQNENLHSGDEFTLRHGDVVKIMLPTGTDLTITENSANYIAKFTLGNNPQETLNTKTFQIEEDTTLAVLNTLDGIIPTGIHQNLMIILITIGALAGVAFIMKHQKKTE